MPNIIELYKNAIATLYLKPGSKPVFRPKLLVPFDSQQLVETELYFWKRVCGISCINYSEWNEAVVAV